MTRKKNIIQRIVVAGLLLKKNKVLLVQRSFKEKIFPNLWEIPSGKKELGETTIQAMQREFKEETSLSISCLNPFSIFDYKINKNNEIRETTQINFLVKLINDKKIKIKLSKEHTDYKWVGSGDINKLYISKETKQILKKILRSKNE
ncbi:NUDIX domain-containing protein [Patescibacteria group bacterium]|nr:NUDIX domain-containing protein [Patescibacteria group bacterium]